MRRNRLPIAAVLAGDRISRPAAPSSNRRSMAGSILESVAAAWRRAKTARGAPEPAPVARPPKDAGAAPGTFGPSVAAIAAPFLTIAGLPRRPDTRR